MTVSTLGHFHHIVTAKLTIIGAIWPRHGLRCNIKLITGCSAGGHVVTECDSYGSRCVSWLHDVTIVTCDDAWSNCQTGTDDVRSITSKINNLINPVCLPGLDSMRLRYKHCKLFAIKSAIKCVTNNLTEWTNEGTNERVILAGFWCGKGLWLRPAMRCSIVKHAQQKLKKTIILNLWLKVRSKGWINVDTLSVYVQKQAKSRCKSEVFFWLAGTALFRLSQLASCTQHYIMALNFN